MNKKSDQTEKVIDLLHSGRHPQSKKYEGKQVMVVGNDIIPLTGRKSDVSEMEKLEKKYGKVPTLVFIPRRDVTYIF